MNVALVATSIHVPQFLSSYADNLARFGHLEEAEVILVGDRKTPAATEEVVRQTRAAGLQVEYWDVTRQEQWLARIPSLAAIIPYNSDNRRNVGFLAAMEHGAEIIISVDDDNFASADDFVGGHCIVGRVMTCRTAQSRNGWYNIGRLLATDPPRRIYPRGFPYSKREGDSEDFTTTTARVVLNSGLWLNDPDVDAVSRLNERISVRQCFPGTILLGKNAWSPINAQNTAVHRDALPCYYYVCMAADLGLLQLDRFGDIWAGYFIRKVIDHLGDAVSVGAPAVVHNRTPHDLLADLKNEIWGMILTEELVEMLGGIELTGSSYEDSYLELASRLRDAVAASPRLLPAAKEYLFGVTRSMETWIAACRTVDGR
jgi:hypothetical protein